MHGSPELSADFTHFPYTNPQAPVGGRLVLGELGTFDSLNRFVLKGTAPWLLPSLTVESLLARNYAEPFALYGLLAETVETSPDRSWVAFTLREEARFADGSPVTVEDVIWSMETLGTDGHPRYRAAWAAVSRIDATGPRTLRIDFKEPNRELPLIMGLRPILKKAQFDGVPLTETTSAPIGSGPYRVVEHEAGRFVMLQRNPDWWGADLPPNRGLANFEEIRIEYFRNADALWEAVQTGAVSVFYDGDPVRWAEGYASIPAVQEGRLMRGEIAHQRPTGMDGFAFNTRRALFEDRQVREALALAFDWEWVNDRLYRGQYSRIQSYFDNSSLGFDGPAEGAERALLAPFADSLPQGTLEGGWQPPVSDGTGRDRRNLRKAGSLLAAAGWEVVDGVRQKDGQPLSFEILVASADHQTLASLWASALERIGVVAEVRLVDSAQYRARLTEFDFDMIVYTRRMSLSPGTEQLGYFGSAARDTNGSRNYMGVAAPAVDAAIAAMLAAETREAFDAAVRALDRVLTAGVYVIPFGYLEADRLAWQAELSKPGTPSLYGWWGWHGGIGTWWRAK